MKNGNPHKPLRSSWRSEVFAKAKTSKGTIVTNRSIGRNTPGTVFRNQGTCISQAGVNSIGGYRY